MKRNYDNNNNQFNKEDYRKRKKRKWINKINFIDIAKIEENFQEWLENNDYENVGRIGKGAFALIFKGTKDNESFAFKVPINEKANQLQFKEWNTLQEIYDKIENNEEIRIHLPNPKYDPFIWENNGNILLVTKMEKFSTTLERIILQDTNRTLRQNVCWLLGIALALQGLHESDFTHNDVKTNNVMVDTKGTAKLIDFGCATRISQKECPSCGIAFEKKKGLNPCEGIQNDKYGLATIAMQLWFPFFDPNKYNNNWIEKIHQFPLNEFQKSIINHCLSDQTNMKKIVNSLKNDLFYHKNNKKNENNFSSLECFQFK